MDSPRRRPWTTNTKLGSIKLEIGVFTSKGFLRERLLQKPAATAGAILVALGVFAYFASVTVSFPGEASVSRWVQSWRTPWLDTLMEIISVPGVLAVAGPMVLLAAAALYIAQERATGILGDDVLTALAQTMAACADAHSEKGEEVAEWMARERLDDPNYFFPAARDALVALVPVEDWLFDRFELGTGS